MKKIILLIAVTTFTNAAFTQLSLPKFGINAGINVSKTTISGGGLSFSTSSLVGLRAGGFAEFQLGKNFELQPELQYSRMGGKIDFSAFGESGNGSLNLDYLAIPVLVKYKISETGLNVYAGPQLGILMSAKGKALRETTENLKDNFKSTDFAGVFGAEYNFPLGIILSTRYQAGFSNIGKDIDGDGKMTNSAFSFTVSYKF